MNPPIPQPAAGPRKAAVAEGSGSLRKSASVSQSDHHSGGSLSGLAAEITQSPSAQAQLKLRHDINGSPQVQAQMQLQHELNNSQESPARSESATAAPMNGTPIVQRVVSFRQQTGESTLPTYEQIVTWLGQSGITVAPGSDRSFAIQGIMETRNNYEFKWAYGQQAFLAELDNFRFRRRQAPYAYRYSAFDSNGLCNLNVMTQGERDPVGYARFTIENIPTKTAPTALVPYGKQDVLAREGKVCHLTHLYNNTLLRDGPADIYSGFGTQLLQTVENDARSAGAKLVYLEAAKSDVRIDPNTNDRQMQDSSTFYAKYGYGVDSASAAHNRALAMTQGMSFGLGAGTQELATYVERQLTILLEGMLSKRL